MHEGNPKKEMPRPKDFGFEIPKVDRERGHVFIRHDGITYKWFLRENGDTVIAVDFNEKNLPDDVVGAMKLQVRAILGPELKNKKEDAS